MASMTGEWQGYYIYGPEYGEKLSGEKVEFRLSLLDTGDNEFEGKCLDLNSSISTNNPAFIKGFMEDDFISFTKEYKTFYSIDKDNKVTPYSPMEKPQLNYDGYYNPESKSFSGNWEFTGREDIYGDGYYVELATGTWEMKRV